MKSRPPDPLESRQMTPAEKLRGVRGSSMLPLLATWRRHCCRHPRPASEATFNSTVRATFSTSQTFPARLPAGPREGQQIAQILPKRNAETRNLPLGQPALGRKPLKTKALDVEFKDETRKSRYSLPFCAKVCHFLKKLYTPIANRFGFSCTFCSIDTLSGSVWQSRAPALLQDTPHSFEDGCVPRVARQVGELSGVFGVVV